MPNTLIHRDILPAELKALLPDPTTLDVQLVPANARRDLFRDMKLHDPGRMQIICSTLDVNSATISRNLFFQIGPLIGFDVHGWLDDYHTLNGTISRGGRAVRSSAHKNRTAHAMLESLGYRWNEAGGIWVKPAPVTDPVWE